MLDGGQLGFEFSSSQFCAEELWLTADITAVNIRDTEQSNLDLNVFFISRVHLILKLTYLGHETNFCHRFKSQPSHI